MFLFEVIVERHRWDKTRCEYKSTEKYSFLLEGNT